MYHTHIILNSHQTSYDCQISIKQKQIELNLAIMPQNISFPNHVSMFVKIKAWECMYLPMRIELGLDIWPQMFCGRPWKET